MRLISFLFAFLSAISLFAQDLTEDLLIHYTFDGDLLDVSGNEYHGESTTVTYAADHLGNPNSAANFDGIDDFIELPNVNELRPELPVSMAFWIKYDSYDPKDRALFCTSYEENVNTGVHFTTQASTGKYAVGFGDGANSYGADSRRTYVSEDSVETGVWHHIAIVVTAGNFMKIYVDCEEPGGSYSGSGGSLAYSLLPGTIGKHDQHTVNPGYHFKGQLSDFYYWNREVSLDEFNFLCDPTGGMGVASIEETDFSVFPNPTTGQFTINYSGERPTTVVIQSMMGNVLCYLPYTEFVALDEIESGYYLIRLLSNLGEVVGIERLVIAR